MTSFSRRGSHNSHEHDDAPFHYSPANDPEDIICGGSDTEQTMEEIRVKHLRYEEQAKRIRNGHLPILQSARVQGPLTKESGWLNPWRYQEPEEEGWWRPGAPDMMFTKSDVMKRAAEHGLGHLRPAEALAWCKSTATMEARLTTERRFDVNSSPTQMDSEEEPSSSNDEESFIAQTGVLDDKVTAYGYNKHEAGGKIVDETMKEHTRVTKRPVDSNWLKGSHVSKCARWEGPAISTPTPLPDPPGDRARRRQQIRFTQLEKSQQHPTADLESSWQDNLEVAAPKPSEEASRESVHSSILSSAPDAQLMWNLSQSGMRQQEVGYRDDFEEDFTSEFERNPRHESQKRCYSAGKFTEPEPSVLALASSPPTRKQQLQTPATHVKSPHASSAGTFSNILPKLPRPSETPKYEGTQGLEDVSFVTEIAPSSRNVEKFQFRKKRTKLRQMIPVQTSEPDEPASVKSSIPRELLGDNGDQRQQETESAPQLVDFDFEPAANVDITNPHATRHTNFPISEKLTSRPNSRRGSSLFQTPSSPRVLSDPPLLPEFANFGYLFSQSGLNMESPQPGKILPVIEQTLNPPSMPNQALPSHVGENIPAIQQNWDPLLGSDQAQPSHADNIALITTQHNLLTPKTLGGSNGASITHVAAISSPKMLKSPALVNPSSTSRQATSSLISHASPKEIPELPLPRDASQPLIKSSPPHISSKPSINILQSSLPADTPLISSQELPSHTLPGTSTKILNSPIAKNQFPGVFNNFVPCDSSTQSCNTTPVRSGRSVKYSQDQHTQSQNRHNVDTSVKEVSHQIEGEASLQDGGVKAAFELGDRKFRDDLAFETTATEEQPLDEQSLDEQALYKQLRSEGAHSGASPPREAPFEEITVEVNEVEHDYDEQDESQRGSKEFHGEDVVLAVSSGTSSETSSDEECDGENVNVQLSLDSEVGSEDDTQSNSGSSSENSHDSGSLLDEKDLPGVEIAPKTPTPHVGTTQSPFQQSSNTKNKNLEVARPMAPEIMAAKTPKVASQVIRPVDQSPWITATMNAPPTAMPPASIDPNEDDSTSGSDDAIPQPEAVESPQLGSPDAEGSWQHIEPPIRDEEEITPFKDIMTPPSPARSQSMEDLPSTQLLTEAALDNPWASKTATSGKSKKRVSFGGLPFEKDESEEASPFPKRTPGSPPPPEHAEVFQEDSFDDSTIVVSFGNHFNASRKPNLIPDTSDSQINRSPAVNAQAEAFLSADQKASSPEKERHGTISVEPSRNIAPWSEAMDHSVWHDSDREDDTAFERSLSNSPTGNLGIFSTPMPKFNMDDVLGEAEDFLADWSVDVEIKKAKEDIESNGAKRRRLFGIV